MLTLPVEVGHCRSQFDAGLPATELPVGIVPMLPVSKTTAHHLSHATGYLGLGMLNEAAEELAKIPPNDSALPEVLSTRIDLHMATKEWALVVRYGEQLARSHPEVESGWIGWAYALRELNRVEEARAVLLEAEPHHGKKCGLLHYNLACYYCLLGNMAEAKNRLSMACKMDKHWKAAALDDPDLTALWDSWDPAQFKP